LKWSLRRTRFSLGPFIRLLSLPLLVALTTALCFVYVDTLWFHGVVQPSTLELTPLNFLRYNMLPSNLAEHGLHPRWLHLVVNMPMIATPGLLYYVLRAELDLFTSRSEEGGKRNLGVVQTMQRSGFLAYYWVRWTSTSLLSIQPHQEPRFLTPLLVPMIALAVNNARILSGRKVFLVIWISTNLVLALLFGVLHQGGVVPSLFRVHDIVYNDAVGIRSHDVRVVYWKTYMPPRHLLATPQTDVDAQEIAVQDLAGASPDAALDALLALTPYSRSLAAFLVAPFYAVQELKNMGQTGACVNERERVFPHLDLDHIGESVQVGWRDGLSLGIFDVDVACLHRV
ncbi:Alg9-like mannosyltransferase family-domain-containing protein, partial [Trametes elegans]